MEASPNNHPASTPSVGFFDLSPEIRNMIYHYYYGSFEPILVYHSNRNRHRKPSRHRPSRPQPSRPHNSTLQPSTAQTSTVPRSLASKSARKSVPSSTPIQRSTWSGIPDEPLNLVSKAFAAEATQVWHEKSTAFTLDVSECSMGLQDLSRMEGYYKDLNARLVSLQVFSEVVENISWLKLLRSCPKLRIVDFTYAFTAGTSEPKEQFVQEAISQATDNETEFSPDAEYDELEEFDLQDLAWAMENLGRRDYRVTGRVRAIVYNSSLDRLAPREKAPNESHLLQTDTEFTIGPKEYTSVSRTCTTCHGFRVRWVEDAAKPMIAETGPEEWEEMILTSVDGEDVWTMP